MAIDKGVLKVVSSKWHKYRGIHGMAWVYLVMGKFYVEGLVGCVWDDFTSYCENIKGVTTSTNCVFYWRVRDRCETGGTTRVSNTFSVVGSVDLLRSCVIESKWLVWGHECYGELWMEWGMGSSIYGVSDRLLSSEERCLGLVDVPLEVSVFSREYG